jgi:hypothetical protein
LCKSFEFSASRIVSPKVDGQGLDTSRLPLVGRKVVEVALHRLGQLVTFLDDFELHVQECREA